MKVSLSRRAASALLALTLAASLALPAAAAEGEEPPAAPAFPTAVKLSASPEDGVLESGALYLNVESDTQGAEIPAETTYRWFSSDPEVAAVPMESGVSARVTSGGRPGTADITVRVTLPDGTELESQPFPVTNPGVTIDKSALELKVRETAVLTVHAYGPPGAAPITWSSSDVRVADYTGSGSAVTVRAVAAGTATITALVGDSPSVSCTVTVSEIPANDISADADAGAPLQFSSLTGRLEGECRRVLDSSLYKISGLSVPTSQGTLYYGYTSEANPGAGVGGEPYFLSGGDAQIDNLYFVPKSTFSGTARIRYTGYDRGDASFSGTILVDVSAASSSAGIYYSISGQDRLDFQLEDFSNVCFARTGLDLSYVTFSQPNASRGTLYYNYSGSDLDSRVLEDAPYYPSKSPRLAGISFVAAEDYSGTVTVSYRGYAAGGRSYSGTVTIAVSTGAGTSGDLRYSTAKNHAVRFSVGDFNSLCQDRTDSSLDYVRFFSLPSSSRGTLYYDYTSSGGYSSEVSASRNYYRSSSPYLDEISFVPADRWTGTVEIPFTGYSRNDERFSGTVEITVGGGSASSYDLHYSVKRNRAADFDADDFDAYCEDLTGRHLQYVRFDLPASSRGALRYNYSSSSSTGSAVSASTSYYRNSSPYLDNVSFVPKSGWTGTAEIDFTGWDTNGERFSGTVEVAVEEGASAAGVIAYTAAQDAAVHFKTADFSDFCDDETGRDLHYVRFDPPASSRGTLRYNYASASSPGSKITSSTSYYRNSSPYISNLTFVPAKGYTGTVDIGFSGWATNGEKFTGTVEITLKRNDAGPIYYATAAGAPVRFQLSSFQSACGARGAGSFSSAAFTPPAAAVGKLRQGYESAARPGGAVSASQTYRASGSPLVSEIVFVPAAGFTGTAVLAYTGTDTQGKTYSGTVSVSVTGTPASSFTDMGGRTWAAPAVEYLYANGIVTGTGGGKFSPDASITRGSFMLMLDRAYHFPAAAGAGFGDVPAASVYADAVGKARALGIAEGAGSKFHPKDPMTRQQAAVFLTRAMRANGWTITEGTRADLAGFADGAAVSNYAVGSLSAMVRLGVFQGNSAGRLNPSSPLTRAQMAVILYRAVSL